MVSRTEFLNTIGASKSLGEAAARLGVRPQSVQARLLRINAKPAGKQGARPTLSDKELEIAWSEALDLCDYVSASEYFDEMCRRLA